MELPNLANHVFVITGANSGIGKATARGLAEHGATVVMVCRSKKRGEKTRKELVRETENNRVDLLIADLASQAQVRHLAFTVREQYDRLDGLINNAGIILANREITRDGVEKTLAVNHLAPFLLTNLLLKMLKESAPARVVNVTSEMHRRADLDFGNLQGEKSYDGLNAYAQSKLANILFTYELARRLKGTGVRVNCVHPGTVDTNIWRKQAGWIPWLMSFISALFASPGEGTKGLLYLAASEEVDDASGHYFDQMKQATSSDESYDEQFAARLWEISEELTDLHEHDPSS